MLDEGDPLWQDVLVCGNQDGIQEQLVVLQDEVGSLAFAVDARAVLADVQGDVAADDVGQAQQWPLTFVMQNLASNSTSWEMR